MPRSSFLDNNLRVEFFLIIISVLEVRTEEMRIDWEVGTLSFSVRQEMYIDGGKCRSLLDEKVILHTMSL